MPHFRFDADYVFSSPFLQNHAFSETAHMWSALCKTPTIYRQNKKRMA